MYSPATLQTSSPFRLFAQPVILVLPSMIFGRPELRLRGIGCSCGMSVLEELNPTVIVRDARSFPGECHLDYEQL